MAALKVVLQDREPHQAQGGHVEDQGHRDARADDQGDQGQGVQVVKPAPQLTRGEEAGVAMAIATVKIESSSSLWDICGFDRIP